MKDVAPSIEIYGGDFHNLGGQLMLYAVTKRLREKCPGVRCAIDAEGNSPYSSRASYGLYTLFPSFPRSRPRFTKVARPLGAFVSKLVKPKVFFNYGLVGSNQCDAFLDISGYAYGDKWPIESMYASLSRIRAYQKHKKPCILMPQMFGPFSKNGYTKAFDAIADCSRLIYARDQMSHEAALEAVSEGNKGKVKCFPDLTIEIEHAGLPSGLSVDFKSRFITIVPNSKMLEKTSDEWREMYAPLLVLAAQTAKDKGYEVMALQHEKGTRDKQLVDEICEKAGAIPVSDPDPLKLKAVLAASSMVISSRFHAVVSSLSSGTPCLSFGWAHKYGMVHRDFNLPETSFTEPLSFDELRSKLDVYLADLWMKEASDRIREAKKGLLQRLDLLWDEIYAQIGL